MSSITSEPTTESLRWSIHHSLDEESALELAGIAQELAGVRLDEYGALERVAQPVLESMRYMLLDEAPELRNQLPKWLLEQN